MSPADKTALAPLPLTRVGARAPLKKYVTEVWQRRQFIYSLARFRIEAENQKSRFGMGWVIARPIINAAVYGLIFGVLLGGSKPPHFVEFLLVGIFFFEFFSGSFGGGARSITTNSALVQSLAFPRMALPLALVTQKLLEFIPMIFVMMGLVTVLGNSPHWHWLLIFPLSILLTVFNTGVALIAARVLAKFQDLKEFIPYVIRLLFFTTGIFFSFDERFKDHPTVLRIVDFQPVHEFLSLARSLMLSGHKYEVRTEYWLYAGIWSFSLLIIGVVVFWSAEEEYGRVA